MEIPIQPVQIGLTADNFTIVVGREVERHQAPETVVPKQRLRGTHHRTESMWDSPYIGLSTFKSRDANCPVTTVFVCAYANQGNEGDENGRPPTNHWAMFLKISESQSVKLDMIPGDGSDGLTGMLVIDSKWYLYTNQAIFTTSFPTKGDPTVNNLISSLHANGMHRYKFTEAQEGCRYWNYVAIDRWQSAGFLEPGSSELAFTSLSHYYVYPTGQELNPMEEGSFF